MIEGFRQVGERLSNWGRWGADDTLGTLNLITPEIRADAATLVSTGHTVPLGLAFDRDGPQLVDGRRQNTVHLMTRLGDREPEPGGFVYLDDAVFMHTQCATQVDALAHVAYDGVIYGGRPLATVTQAGAQVLGIESMRGGIQGRGVLLDIPRHRSTDRLGPSDHVGVSELQSTADEQGIDIREGDVLLIRTGWMSVFSRDGDRRAYLATEPGIGLDAAEWLHERGVAFVGSDNWGIEVSPGQDPRESMPLHCVLIRDMGMPLGEMFDLDELAVHCAETGVWEFQFTCLPLPITGGVGSPVAPIATF